MNTFKITLILLAATLVTCSLSSCADIAVGGEYGNALIYMPQATKNLGTDNNLNISLSASEEIGTVTKTTLGIYRSGTQSLKTATVKLGINADTLAKAVAIANSGDALPKFDIYKTAVLLDAKYYGELPRTLTIPDGGREATTQLILNDKVILADYPVGSVLVLPVFISEPTRYELNYSLSLTMVIITIVE